MLVFADGERFHPLAVEAYLAGCHLLRDDGGRWRRRRREATGDWDAAAGVTAEMGTMAKGAARARALAGRDARHCLRYVDPARVEKRRREEPRRRDARSGPSWFAPLVVALILAAWWGIGSWSWKSLLGLGLLVGAGIVGLVALRRWLARRGRREWVDNALAVSSTAAVAGFAIWGSQEIPRWIRVALLVLAFVSFFALVLSWAGRLTDRARKGVERLVLFPVTVWFGWLLSAVPCLIARWWVDQPVPGCESARLWITAFWAVVLLIVAHQHLVTASMAVFSSVRREVGDEAAAAEKKLRQQGETAVHPYYGRVRRGPDDRWAALEYHFFYAFNDWRHHKGVNFHEADWEWAMVWLERHDGDLVPRRLLLSQHHRVGGHDWRELDLADGAHPVIHVAAGSHANYVGLHERRVQDLLDGAVAAVARLLDVGEQRREAASEAARSLRRWFDEKLSTRPEDDSTVDDPRGGGRVVGPALPAGVATEDWHPWSPVVLDGSQDWVDYPGLWGVRSLLRNESGPPGPRWVREEKLTAAERLSGREDPAWKDPERRQRDAREAAPRPERSA